MIDVAYDVETLPNLFTCCIMPLDEHDGTVWLYEISERRNDARTLVHALRSGYFRRMFGFNNLNFDSPIIHRLVNVVENGYSDAAWICAHLKQLAQEIINSGSRWSHRVHWKDEVAKQVDLFLIHHFDNHARATSLKALEFAMRARRVQDMPFPHDTILTPAQMDIVRDYNVNDTRETKGFALFSRPQIEFREKLGPKHLNDNDTKIGKSFFIDALERRSPGICYTGPERKPRQTWRISIPLADVILPVVTFERPETRAVLERLRGTTLQAEDVQTGEGAKVATKGVFKDLTADIDGFRFWFGTGGIHGSVSNRIVHASATHEIADLDVTSYYPSIAIVHKVYPHHLGMDFVEVYADLKQQRVEAKRAKDMVTSDALKLALNGVYGDSNNIYGPFYDPQYTMTITVNGQLMLVMLAEQLVKVPGLELIQANTDGITVRFPRTQRKLFEIMCMWWQGRTGMELEETQYQSMWIRDVNSYIAKTIDGKYKRKGAYDYELKIGDQKAWHKDHSGLVIQKAACAALCEDVDPADFIRRHDDPWDFLMMIKAKGAHRLELGDGTECQKTTRYYIAHDGQQLVKVMPPLAKTPDRVRRQIIHADGQAVAYGTRGAYRCSICGDIGPTFKFIYEFDEHNKTHHTYKVKVCDVFDGGDLPGLNYDFYLEETRKLLLQ